MTEYVQEKKVTNMLELKKASRMNHRRYYRIAGITIQVESDLPITDSTFLPQFEAFEVDGPGEDTIIIRHHFYLPDLKAQALGKEVYRKPPWAIYKTENRWIYLGISPDSEDRSIHKIAIFNQDYTQAEIYNNGDAIFCGGGLHSLTLFPTDQILLAQLMADRRGCFIHSSGVIYRGKGLLFVGHSEAGKSTMATMLKDKSEILCDDRIILKKHLDVFRIHGTWSHGDVPDVSANSGLLTAIFFLEKSERNRFTVIENKREIFIKLLETLIQPFARKDWWGKMLVLLEEIVCEVPCYNLQFDKSGKVLDLIEQIWSKK